MKKLEEYLCLNEQCQDYGISHKGNIAVRGNYGKDKSRQLLYCKTCGKRFSAAQFSPFFGLHLPPEQIQQIIDRTTKGKSIRLTARDLVIDKDTVNRVIQRASEHCTDVLSDLLTSLEMDETQLKELIAFVKKRKILRSRKPSVSGEGDCGSE